MVITCGDMAFDGPRGGRLDPVGEQKQNFECVCMCVLWRGKI